MHLARVSAKAGRTHVRSNKTQFADGKLPREAFEDELEDDAYRQTVNEAQRQMMSWFLPWMPRPSRTETERCWGAYTDVTDPIPSVRLRKSA